MIELDGQRLSLAEVSAVARGEERVTLAARARLRIEESRRVVERIIAENRTVYGINTGFGKLSDIRIDPSQIRELQLNLVRSHSCGLGNPRSNQSRRSGGSFRRKNPTALRIWKPCFPGSLATPGERAILSRSWS